MKVLRNIRTSLLVSVLSASVVAGTVNAGGVPTIDVTTITQISELIAEAKLQLKEMLTANIKLDTQIENMVQQVATLKQQYEALTKGLTLADLGLDPDSLLEEFLPEIGTLSSSIDAAKSGDWSSVLSSGKVGGVSTTTRVNGIFDSMGLKKSDVDTLTSSDDVKEKRIGTAANTAAFLSVAAESSQEESKKSLERLTDYSVKVGETQTLKESIDLNTLATIELGNALANIWSMETVQTVGQGEMGVMDAATAADEAKFLKVTGAN